MDQKVKFTRGHCNNTLLYGNVCLQMMPLVRNSRKRYDKNVLGIKVISQNSGNGMAYHHAETAISYE